MILITGATGFLGSHLAASLASKGEKIIAIRRASSRIPPILIPFSEVIQWKEADMMDIFALEEAFDQVEYIYHCAAVVSFDPDMRNSMIAINSQGTANIVNLALRFPIKKLVHVSSVAALGEAKPGNLVTENTPWEYNDNSTGYGISKFESECEVWRAITEGLNAVIVNPSIILGELDLNEGSGRMFAAVKNGLDYYTSGSNGMVSVQDVVACMIGLMNSKESAQRYILSSENMSYKDFFNQVATHMGKIPPAKEARPWMLKLASNLPFLSKRFGINKESARLATSETRYDNSKIRAALSYIFEPISEVIASICKSIDWHE